MNDRADTVASQLEDAAPEPSGAEISAPSAATESAPQAGPVPSQPGGPAPRTPRDRQGREFDPSLHQVDDAGRPILTLKGELRMKGNAGRKAGGTATRASYVPPISSAPAAPVGPDPRIRSTAEVTVGMISLAFAFAGGEHWQTSESERENLVQAWCGYYAIRGMVDLPPEVVLITAYGGWIASNPKRVDDAVSGIRSALARVGILSETPQEEAPNPAVG